METLEQYSGMMARFSFQPGDDPGFQKTECIGSGRRYRQSGSAEFTVSVLQPGIEYCLAVSAYDYSQNESDYANQVAVILQGKK